MLTKLFYKMVHNMPREYKFGIGHDIINLSWNCLDRYLEINVLENNEKLLGIEKLSLCFDKLKLRIRLAQEMGIISEKTFSHLQNNYLFSIGDQMGGWQRWAISVN